MEIQVISGDISNLSAGAIIVPCFEHNTPINNETGAVDRALGGAITQLVNEGEIKGKCSEITLLHSLGKLPAARVLVLGLGKATELTSNKLRNAFADACRYLRNKNVQDLAVIPLGSGVNGISPETCGQTLAEGAMLGLYTFRNHITPKEDNKEIKRISIVAGNAERAMVGSGVNKGTILSESVNMTREMVNEPSNYKNPTTMAQKAVELGKQFGIAVEVFEKEQMEKMGMGALLGVAQGSRQPPKFIVMHYKGRTDDKTIDLAMVGKGITFDSGGISLKPPEKMDEMKGDMAGGASVMTAIAAIARLSVKLNVSAFIPATENMPGGNAFRPGDILTAMNGKTIEILTTDAEGRLILADALTYASRMEPKAMVDVATLTGACVVALGDVCTGGFSTNQALMDKVTASAAETGEPVWQMPMFDEYHDQIKSNVADMKNSGGRNGGAITAAKMLAEFTGSIPWVHLDIAGVSLTDKERGYIVKGGTGNPVRTLVNLAMKLSA